MAGYLTRLNGTGGVVLRLALAISSIAAERPTFKAALGNLKFHIFIVLSV